jgi:hypothetical protein
MVPNASSVIKSENCGAGSDRGPEKFERLFDVMMGWISCKKPINLCEFPAEEKSSPGEEQTSPPGVGAALWFLIN